MKYAFATIIILFPLIIVISVYQMAAFDISWYEKKFSKLAVYGELGKERVDSQTENLFAYLRGRRELEKIYYTSREEAHLRDVKQIMAMVKLLNIALIFIFSILAVYILKKANTLAFAKIIFKAGIASVAGMALLILFSFLFFDQLFFLFHKIAFANNYWLLSPEEEFLVVIFPEQLFADMAVRIFMRTLAASFLFIMLASAVILLYKKKI